MIISRKILLMLVTLAVTLVAVFALPRTAAASIWSAAERTSLIMATCSSGPEQYPELARLHNMIAAAGSLSEAHGLALTPMAVAIDAVRNARSIAPFSDDLGSAEAQLTDMYSRIEAADTPRRVADEFSGMLLAKLDNDKAASVKVGKTGCSYSTGEVIAIVVGLILGIIPGLIMLIVLC